MRKTSVRLTSTRINGRRYYCVTLPKPGRGRSRRFFRDRREAETFLQQKKIEKENQGTAAFSISESLRVEAVECQKMLSSFGKTIRDATGFYADYLRRIAKSSTVADVVAEMIRNRTADGLSQRYIGDLRVRLGRFVKAFGTHIIAAITPREIDEWLRSLNVGGVTRNTFRRRLAALFSFARARGYIRTNPVNDVQRAKEAETPVEILTVEQTARLLEAAGPETLPYWAIGAFAGLRPAEVERLDWNEVDFEGCFIHVKAKSAKTGSRRIVEMSPNLVQWLEPFACSTGAVCPANLRRKIETDREKTGLLDEWPHNGLRHSYGSYWLAGYQDAAKLALQMGNSPAMIFRHYREVVKPKDARTYWSIRPASAANVVPMAG